MEGQFEKNSTPPCSLEHDATSSRGRVAPLEGLFYFRPRLLLPSLSPTELCDFVNERGVYINKVEDLYSIFDMLCHIQGVLYYRVRLTTLDSMLNEIDPMETFIRRDAWLESEYDMVHLINTHDHEDAEPFDVLENASTVSLAEFGSIVARHVQAGELVQIK